MRFWRKAAIPVVVVVLAGFGVSPSVWAATSADKAQVNKQLSQLKSQLSEVSGDEADLLGQMDDLNNKKADLDAQVSDLQAKMDAAQRQLDDATSRLAAVQKQVDDAQAKLAQAQAQLAISAQQMRDQAVSAYMGTEANSNITNLVLHASDMREVTAASEYLGQIVKDKRRIVEEHRELEGQANDARQALEGARKQAQASRDAIAQHTQDLANQKSQLDGVNAQLNQQAQDQAALLGNIESKRASIQAQVDSLQRESDNIGNILRTTSPSNGPPPPAGKGILANPVPGAARTSPFGMRLDPVTGKYQLHAGQDFGVPVGTAIHSSGDGTVATVQSASASGGYGNYTCISHGNGMATCYAHQSQILVSVGQKVTRNQIIGLSGNTGYSTGPHLHWEVRINGNPVEPTQYL